MLRIEGSSKKLCDGVSRRKFIEVGTLSAFGLSISDLLRGEANAAVRSKVSGSPKSVILIWQHGGPSQLDTFDMKMDQPEEVRGPYQPINTNVPGIQVSELMKYHAKVMDHCSIIRSFTHGNGDHWAAAHWMLTGYLGAPD